FCLFFCFFFSSRRRHTRWPRDWSSDVCSSDLPFLDHPRKNVFQVIVAEGGLEGQFLSPADTFSPLPAAIPRLPRQQRCGKCGQRSEERRVGKECRSRWWPEQCNEREEKKNRNV